jgi:hypothetical protein
MMNHISDSNELMADINEIVSSSPMMAEIKVVLSFFYSSSENFQNKILL